MRFAQRYAQSESLPFFAFGEEGEEAQSEEAVEVAVRGKWLRRNPYHLPLTAYTGATKVFKKSRFF